MPTSPVSQWSNTARLDPLYDEEAPVQNVTIKAAASTPETYPRGQVLGELVGNDEIQQITTDSTGGTFTVSFGGQTTAPIAFDATAAQVEAALEALSTIGENNVSVTGSAGTYVITFTNALGRQNVAQVTCGSASLTGNAHTMVPSTLTAGSAGTAGTFKKYDPDATDGSQKARCILQYAISVDSSGNVTPPGEWGTTQKYAPVYIGGTYKTSELTGLTEQAVVDLGGVLVQGTVTSGIFSF